MKNILKNKVLVCDDDEGISEVIKIILNQAGYIVSSISNGKSIQKKVKEFSPNLILLDIWMPGIDGKQATKLLKRNKTTKNIPIIMISALNSTESNAHACGADDFLLKPFDMNILLSKVKKYTIT